MILFLRNNLLFFLIVILINLSKLQTQFVFHATNLTATIHNSTQIQLKWVQSEIQTNASTRFRINVTNTDSDELFEWPGNLHRKTLDYDWLNIEIIAQIEIVQDDVDNLIANKSFDNSFDNSFKKHLLYSSNEISSKKWEWIFDCYLKNSTTKLTNKIRDDEFAKILGLICLDK
jgi:hypothetical protein